MISKFNFLSNKRSLAYLTMSYLFVFFMHLSIVNAAEKDSPKILLHLNFESNDWIAHSAGVPDLQVKSSKLVKGKVGKAVQIMKPQDAANIGTLGNIDKAKGTLSFWYKPSFDRGRKANYPLFWSGKSTTKGANSMWLWLWSGRLRFDVRDLKDSYCIVSAKNWKANKWVHIAAVWDCKKGTSLWVNGKKNSELKSTWKAVKNKRLLIGTGEQYFGKLASGGVLDELKIYDQALNKNQIIADFQRKSNFKYKVNTLKSSKKKHISKTKKEALETLFHLDFENNFKANTSSGTAVPTNKNLPKLVKGIVGKGTTLKNGQVMRYLSKGIVNKKHGAISAWIRTPEKNNPANMVIFREDGPNTAGGNSLWFWYHAGRGLRIDPRDPGDNYTVMFKTRTWEKGEWHHVIYCWDSESGTKCYIDGQLACNASGQGGVKTFVPLKWQPRIYEALLLGAHTKNGASPWTGVIDEVKFYNRPLDNREAYKEYAHIGKALVAVEVLDPYLFAGKTEKVNIVLNELASPKAKYDISYVLRDKNNAKIASGKIGQVTVVRDKIKQISLELTLPTKGKYELLLKLSKNGKDTLVKAHVYALLEKEEAGKFAGKLVLVDEVDAVTLKNLPESAPSKIINSPAGKYREAGLNRYDRFALKFNIKEPNRPHVAVITYPDDKIRTMEALLQPLEVNGDYQAQTGVYTGGEYPLSNKMLTQEIVFWPQCKKMSFIFMTVNKDQPAAVKNMKIYRIKGGFKRLTVKPFKGSVPARSIGLYHEDPVIEKCYGITDAENNDMAYMPGFETAVDRMLDYHQSFGTDTIHYPLAWYRGPLYGSLAEPHSISARPHPKGFPKYLLRRLAARGMKLNAWLHLHQIDSLKPYIILDEERVYAGEETPVNMRFDNHLFYRAWHGKDPVLNPIDPHVMKAVKKIVTEIVDRYGNEPNFTGITLNTVHHSMFAFGSLESGYNDINLKRFQKDTGIKIPVNSKDSYRFSKSWKWLMKNAKQEWIDWRCRKIRQYYKEIAAILTAKRKDIKLGIVMMGYPGTNMTCDYLNKNKNLWQGCIEQGINPALYEKDKDIVLRTSMLPADLRWRDRSSQTVLGVQDWRTVNLAPEIVKSIAKTANASVNMHDRYFENAVGRKKPLKNLTANRFVKETGWRVSALNANTYHGIENHIAAMNNMDPFTITKGGYGVGSFGIEKELGYFAQAFRTLPAVKFDDVPALSDPVRVRQKVVDGKNYFYVLNRLPYKVTVTIKLSDSSSITDLVSDKLAGKDTLELSLKPYDLRTFSTAADNLVNNGSSQAPAKLIANLKRKVTTLGKQYKDLRTKGINIKNIKPYLRKAQRCLKTGHYARLYFLLQESWVFSLRLSADKTLQAFLIVPKDYLAKRQKRKISLVAEKAIGIKIDGKFNEAAWSKAKAYDDMDDFMKNKGGLLAKPADCKTSIKMLHDDKNLYLAIHCKDNEASKIVIKPGLRDEPLWGMDDSVEIFLRTPKIGKNGHAQFVVNAGGSRTDLFNGNIYWSTDWKAASRAVKDGWVTEVAIPFHSVCKNSSVKDGWSFNIARTRRNHPKSALIGDNKYEWKSESKFVKIKMK